MQISSLDKFFMYTNYVPGLSTITNFAHIVYSILHKSRDQAPPPPGLVNLRFSYNPSNIERVALMIPVINMFVARLLHKRVLKAHVVQMKPAFALTMLAAEMKPALAMLAAEVLRKRLQEASVSQPNSLNPTNIPAPLSVKPVSSENLEKTVPKKIEFDELLQLIPATEREFSKGEEPPGPPTLSREERLMIYTYTTSLYALINSRLSGKQDEYTSNLREYVRKLPSTTTLTNDLITQRVDFLCANLPTALQKLPAYTGIAYRGARLSQNDLAPYKVGESVLVTRFTGASENRLNVMKFLKSHVSYIKSDPTESVVPVLFIITSKQGRAIDRCSFMPTEKEILFAPHTKFIVRSENHDNNPITINLEEE